MSDAGWQPLRKPSPARGTGAASAAVAGSAAGRFGPTPFSKLAIAHLISVGGDALVTLALAGSLFFDISPTAARGRVALSLMLTMAPFAVVAPFLGPAIDRIQGGRRFMVVGAMFGRTIACLAMAKYVHSLLLFPAAFATLVLSKAYGVAKAALVPAVVESDDDLVQANSRLTVGGALIGLVAAIPGVAVLKLLNGAAVLRLAALVFAVGGVAAFRIAPTRVDRKPPPGEIDADVSTRNILSTAGVMAVLRGAVGFLTFLLAFDLRRSGSPAYWFGIVLLASVGGGLVGAAIAPKLRDSFKEERIVIGALIVVVAGGFVAAYFGGRGSAALLAAVVGFSNGIGKLAFDSLVQRDAHEAARGRSFARFEAAFQLAWVVGALIPVLITIGDWVGFALLGLGSLAAAVAYVIVRTKESVEGPLEPAAELPEPTQEPQPQPQSQSQELSQQQP